MIVPPETYNRILALEYRHARVLDEDRLEEWPELFVERGVYKVVPRENMGRPVELPILFCDSRAMMRDRIDSLRRANVFNLHQPRHVVTNVEVLSTGGGEAEVVAAYTVHQTDLEGQTRLFGIGQYRDIVVLTGPEPLFREKMAICDTFAIPNLLAIPL